MDELELKNNDVQEAVDTDIPLDKNVRLMSPNQMPPASTNALILSTTP